MKSTCAIFFSRKCLKLPTHLTDPKYMSIRTYDTQKIILTKLQHFVTSAVFRKFPLEDDIFHIVYKPFVLELYEGCSEIIETIAILSKGLIVIQNNLQSHQVLHIWGLGLNYFTASFNGYDPVAFLRLTPPLYLGAYPITLTFIARSPWFTIV